MRVLRRASGCPRNGADFLVRVTSPLVTAGEPGVETRDEFFWASRSSGGGQSLANAGVRRTLVRVSVAFGAGRRSCAPSAGRRRGSDGSSTRGTSTGAKSRRLVPTLRPQIAAQLGGRHRQIAGRERTAPRSSKQSDEPNGVVSESMHPASQMARANPELIPIRLDVKTHEISIWPRQGGRMREVAGRST